MRQRGQLQLFDPNKVTFRAFEPPAFVQEGAKRYAASRGLSWNPKGLEQTTVDPQRGHAQMLAYKAAQATPGEKPGIRKSYGAMAEHIQDQYKFMTTPEHEGGMGLSVEVTPHDPYRSVHELAADVTQNRRIKVMSTRTTGGSGVFGEDVNDQFRAVHDVFGHVATGRNFSRHGEEAAYRSHAMMFPKEALPALTSETRGQNSFLNYSPEREFPQQAGSQMVGLPAWTMGKGALPRPAQRPRPSYEQQRLFP